MRASNMEVNISRACFKMGVAADQVFGNLTRTLKAKAMYAHTLIVLTSDNGGPAGKLVSGHAGNNFPHRGEPCDGRYSSSCMTDKHSRRCTEHVESA